MDQLDFNSGIILLYLSSISNKLFLDEPKHNNGMMASFIVLYILFTVVNIILYIKRKSVFSPVLAIHQNRSDKAFVCIFYFLLFSLI